MKLTLILTEMAAKKICPDCGKSMAGNHYWYKGGWKCKKSNLQQQDQPDQPNQQAAPTEQPAPSQTPQQPTPKQPPQPNTDQQQQSGVAVSEQPLKLTMDIVAEAEPFLGVEITKINKTAEKVGAQPVTMTVDKTFFKDMERREGGRTIKYKVKMLTVTIQGSTPRIRSKDGSVWNFVGVITPSASGRAILKLTPSTEDTEGIRQMYSANPYYCDHCRTTRTRNETFIVQNGQNYRQVGRNCLADFVGGANPQALLKFFAWFQNEEHLEEFLNSKVGGGSNEGGGGWGHSYYEPIDVLTATVAAVQHNGSYVSAKSETGRPTSVDVRNLLAGTVGRYATETERQEFQAMLELLDHDTVKNKANEILQWFANMSQQEKDANTFFKNIDVMVTDNAVEWRQLGYVVGLYPSYQRAMASAPDKSGVKLIKEWPSDWGKDPRPVADKHAVVKFVRHIQGAYGTSQIINVMFDDGVAASWKYSGDYGVHVDDELTMTGSLEPDSYFEPPRIKFVADRKWLRGGFRQQMNEKE